MADTVGAGLTLALAGLMFYGASTDDSFGAALLAVYVGTPLAVVGAVLTASAIYGHVATRRCDRMKDAETARLEAEAARNDVREVASGMTNVAATAAREGDCLRAVAIAAKIRVIDRDFYDSVLVHDVAIARCLAGPAAGSAVEPPP